jgi:hypothetical protein
MSKVRVARQFINVKDLAKRWSCSKMFIERKLRSDPNFPQTFWVGTRRRFDLDDVEEYERAMVKTR